MGANSERFASIPRLTPVGTVVILGSGPSLTLEDVEYVRPLADAVIAVNDAYLLAPWATILYGGDKKWWTWHLGASAEHTVGRRRYPIFAGSFKYGLERTDYLDVLRLKRGPEKGLALEPDTVATGLNSVYAAINIAVHLGAARIRLLGVDMQAGTIVSNGARRRADHFFGQHPDGSAPPFHFCLQRFATLVQPLADLGVELVNCSPDSALRCFPMRPIREALEAQAA